MLFIPFFLLPFIFFRILIIYGKKAIESLNCKAIVRRSNDLFCLSMKLSKVGRFNVLYKSRFFLKRKKKENNAPKSISGKKLKIVEKIFFPLQKKNRKKVIFRNTLRSHLVLHISPNSRMNFNRNDRVKMILIYESCRKLMLNISQDFPTGLTGESVNREKGNPTHGLFSKNVHA